MLSVGMLASSLTLLPSLPVLVLSSLFLSGCAVWRWLLSWAPCPLGVLATIRVDYLASFEDMRSMVTVLRSLLRVPAYMLAPSFSCFLLCFHSLYAVFSSRLSVSAGSFASGLGCQRHQKILDSCFVRVAL